MEKITEGKEVHEKEKKKTDEPAKPLVVDGRDREVTAQYFKIVSYNQAGELPGHYVKVEKDRLAAVGTGSEPESTFKIYSSAGRSNELVNILATHSHEGDEPVKVVAVQQTGNGQYRVVMKEAESTYLDDLSNFRSVSPEILFRQICSSPGSEFCRYESVLGDSSIILGFDKNGRVLDPTTVEPDSDEATLKIHVAPPCI